MRLFAGLKTSLSSMWHALRCSCCPAAEASAEVSPPPETQEARLHRLMQQVWGTPQQRAPRLVVLQGSVFVPLNADPAWIERLPPICMN